ncbi:integrase core domain-containing protein [Nonomuraea angiospora]
MTFWATGEWHLRQVLAKYERHYNEHRPHQALSPRPPFHDPDEAVDLTARTERRSAVCGLIRGTPVRSGRGHPLRARRRLRPSGQTFCCSASRSR